MTVKQLQSNIGGRSFTSFPTPKPLLNKAKLFKFPVAHVVGFVSSTAILALPLLSLRRMTSANGRCLVGPQCRIPLSTHRVQPSLRSEEILVWVQGKPPREQAGPLNQHRPINSAQQEQRVWHYIKFACKKRVIINHHGKRVLYDRT